MVLNRLFSLVSKRNMGMPSESSAKQVISIIGTTGVGKSQLSVEIAQKFNGEIINADSMQMYQGLDVITNKHPIIERYGIRHHVLNHIAWGDEYDMHRFKKEALLAIEDIHSRGKLPILVGGTHYYLQSVLFNNKMVVTNNDIELETKSKDSIKDLSKDQIAVLEGPEEELINHLQLCDPEMASKFHPNDHRRIKRSLEIFYKTGKKASDIYLSQKESTTSESSLRFQTLFLWVWSEQEILNQRLDARVDKMLESKGMEEIEELYGYYQTQVPTPDCERGVWQVIGFKEFLPWLKSRHDAALKQGIEDMKSRTRKYSKRQVKWIKFTLHQDLSQEKNFNNCGKIYLLDATDLSIWQENVNSRGIEIVDQFLSQHHEKLENIEQIPEYLQKTIKFDAVSGARNAKGHKTCEVCKDSEGKSLIVLARQWEAHITGSKHRSSLKRGKRKRDYEEWLKNKRQEEEEKKP